MWAVARTTRLREKTVAVKENGVIQVTEDPIPTGEIYGRLSRQGAGSVVIHIGLVKPRVDNRRTKGIRLTPAGDLAAELESVEREVREKWEPVDVLLIRRTGELRVGETVLAVAVTATTREAAFGACRQAVERLKREGALRKEELYEG